MTNTETASLILTLLTHDDAQTAREIAAALATTTAAVRPALRQLVESGDLVTSGRAGGTRYVLAVEEQIAAPVQSVELVVTSAVVAQRAERSSSASMVLADDSAWPLCLAASISSVAIHLAAQRTQRPARKPRAARPVIPATVDVLGALTATAARLESGATLAELSARPVPPPARIVIADIAAEVGTLLPDPDPPVLPSRPLGLVLRRECATPTEDVAARKLALQQVEAWGEEHDRATERRETRQHVAMGLVSALMVLAPVAWVVAHLVR